METLHFPLLVALVLYQVILVLLVLAMLITFLTRLLLVYYLTMESRDQPSDFLTKALNEETLAFKAPNDGTRLVEPFPF